MRYVCNPHVACLVFVFSCGRLAMPLVRHGYLGTPRFFPRRSVNVHVKLERSKERCLVKIGMFAVVFAATSMAFAQVGKTDSANVPMLTAERDYAVLEWIESTSGGQQYIDTGIVGQDGMYVEAKMQWKTYDKECHVIGQRGSATADPRFAPITLTNNSQGRWGFYYYSGTVVSIANVSSYLNAEGQGCDIDYSIHSRLTEGFQAFEIYNHNLQQWYAVTNNSTPGAFRLSSTMYLFGQRRESRGLVNASHIRLYMMKIYTNATAVANGVLARDFVPARRKSDNAIGLYDRVTDVFFENGSSTPFVYEEVGARINVSTEPSSFGLLAPAEGEHVAETTSQTYALTGAETFDDGVVGYWDANRVWRAEFDEAVFTPVGGLAEEIALTNFTRDVGAGCSVAWCFKNVACRLGGEVDGVAGNIRINGQDGFMWGAAGQLVRVKAIAPAGTRFVAWTGDTNGIANVHAPSFRWTVTGPRTFTARFATVPRQYEVLEWIGSTSGGSQCINTEVIGTTGIVARAEMSWPTLPSSGTVFLGCRPASDSTQSFRCMPIMTNGNSNPNWQALIGVGTISSSVHLVPGVVAVVQSSVLSPTAQLEVDGMTASGSYTGDLQTELPLYVFANNRGTYRQNYAVARLFSLRLWTGASETSAGTLVRDFVPVRVQSGENEGAVGLYDLVSGRFFENVSAAPFEFGVLPPLPTAGLQLIIR